MRTLLAESTPPQFIDEERLSQPEDCFAGTGNDGGEHFGPMIPGCGSDAAATEYKVFESAEQVVRIFPEAAVLASLHDLVEVGVDGIVMTTPSALNPGGAVQALGRGMAFISLESPQEGQASA